MIIGFFNFCITLVWALIKLIGSLIIAFIMAAICHGMAVAVGAMYYKIYNDRFNEWAEIEAMENGVYGDDNTRTD